MTAPRPSAPLPPVILYSRPGCHLCDETRATLAAIMEARLALGLATAEIVEIDITSDADLEREYFLTIPVVAAGRRHVPNATSPSALRALVEEALGADTRADEATAPPAGATP